MIRDMVNKIADAGANVLFCQKGIDDLAQHYLAKAGIMAVRRVKNQTWKNWPEQPVPPWSPTSKTWTSKTWDWPAL